MDNYTLRSPVALIMFNRPDKVRRVLEAVRAARPPRLYLIADGPRADHPEDEEKVRLTREVRGLVDWDCEVVEEFSDVNLGCRMRPYTGISRVFESEEAAIILEDDCLPCPEFFRYCDEMLERYKDDERIMLVSGTNIAQRKYGGFKRGDYSYHFSRVGSIHGWASWRRAWSKMDINITQWNDAELKLVLKGMLGERFYNNRARVFDMVAAGRLEGAWDFQWNFANLINSGLAVVPCANLVSNIGFASDGTHTSTATHPVAALPYGELKFPLVHPGFVIPDVEYDNIFLELVCGEPTGVRGFIHKWADRVRIIFNKGKWA